MDCSNRLFISLLPNSFELGNVMGSDLPARRSLGVGGFGQDDYIKSYLQNPNIPFITVIKIRLRYYITADLILQLEDLKNHLKTVNLHTFMQVFGKMRS